MNFIKVIPNNEKLTILFCVGFTIVLSYTPTWAQVLYVFGWLFGVAFSLWRDINKK